MSRRFRAPKGNGEMLVVPAFAEVGELAHRNRELLDGVDVAIDGTRLREFRRACRSELLPIDDDRLLFVTGHQPELFHPGVWAKNFAVSGLAERLNGHALNLIVDNDTMKTGDILAPVWDADPANVRLEKREVHEFHGEMPWELYHRVGSENLLRRLEAEYRFGGLNFEFFVGGLSLTTAFRRFAAHISANLPRFRAAYNRAVAEYRHEHGIRSKSHPVPDLAEDELPFWEFTSTGRVRATFTTPPERLRPRALTLTLFVRLCLADWFIHGIGGAKYDEVTDAVIRDFFGIEPPAFGVVTGTLHLPLPSFPQTDADVKRLEAELRRLHWNPEGSLPADHPARLEKATIAADKPAGRAAVRKWFARIRELTAEMRASVADRVSETEHELAIARTEAAANAILHRRDFAWVLHPEETLRPFLEKFRTG